MLGHCCEDSVDSECQQEGTRHWFKHRGVDSLDSLAKVFDSVYDTKVSVNYFCYSCDSAYALHFHHIEQIRERDARAV